VEEFAEGGEVELGGCDGGGGWFRGCGWCCLAQRDLGFGQAVEQGVDLRAKAGDEVFRALDLEL